MNAFDSDFRQHGAALLSEAFADEVTCVPVGGTSKTVAAIVRGQETVDREGEHGSRRMHIVHLSVPRTVEASGGGGFLAAPAVGDNWTIDGVELICEAIEQQSPAFTSIRVVRNATHEQTRPGYRLKR